MFLRLIKTSGYNNLMSEQNFSEHLQAEIKQLQERLEAKKRELGAAARIEEREIFREVFRERFDELAKAIQSAGPVPAAPPPRTVFRDDGVTDLKKEEKIEHLIYVAFEKGPGAALGEARALGDFWVDELHDRLADEYYEKLLEFRRVQRL